MKQKAPLPRGEALLRVITGVLFLAMLFYTGFTVYHTLENPFKTTLAVSVSLAETASARGYVVREETVIGSGSGFVVQEMRDGERAARGAVVAAVYGGGADAAAITEMHELKTRIERITAAAAITSEERKSRAAQAVSDLALSLARRELAASERNIIEAESLVISAPDAEQAQAEIAALQYELDTLLRKIPQSAQVTAPVSGVFDIDIDGFENISPDSLPGLLPDALDTLFAYGSGATGAGRIITGTRWYLALIVEDAQAAKLLDISTVTVRFTKPLQASFEMRVEDVGRSDGASRVVVLSCANGQTLLLDTRSVSAELVFGDETGIRVPKAAIRLEPISDEEPAEATFVYITEGYQATRVRVTILRDFGESYIVEGEVIGDPRQGAMSRLREGSEVIVKANNLYDGKTVR